MDTVDRQLLNIIQESFPLSVHPYKDLAEALGLTEQQVIDRIRDLKAGGIIRRVGGIINSRSLGYDSTLCAVHVEEDDLNELAAYLNTITGVTHNYLRDHYYNLWFTLTLPSLESLPEAIRSIENKFAVKIIQLPAKKTYKIKVSFEMGEKMQYDSKGI